MDFSSAVFAAGQVTQCAEACSDFSPAAFAFKKANASSQESILTLIENLPNVGTYNAQGQVSSASVGQQLNLQA